MVVVGWVGVVVPLVAAGLWQQAAAPALDWLVMVVLTAMRMHDSGAVLACRAML